jgi:hypothetical protein
VKTVIVNFIKLGRQEEREEEGGERKDGGGEEKGARGKGEE